MINQLYHHKDILYQAQQAYHQSIPKKIMLTEFFDKKTYRHLQSLLYKSSKKKICIPNKYSYNLITSPDIESLLKTLEIKQFFSVLLGKKVNVTRLSIKEFSWKDYTLIHDEHQTSEQQFFLFIPTTTWNSSFGGQRVLLTSQGKGESIIFIPAPNTLCVLDKRKEDLLFTKYLNYKVGKEKVVVIEGTLT